MSEWVSDKVTYWAVGGQLKSLGENDQFIYQSINLLQRFHFALEMKMMMNMMKMMVRMVKMEMMRMMIEITNLFIHLREQVLFVFKLPKHSLKKHQSISINSRQNICIRWRFLQFTIQEDIWYSTAIESDIIQWISINFKQKLSISKWRNLLNARTKCQVECLLRDVRGGVFSSGAGREQKSAGRGEGENPRGGAKERVNQLIQKFD